MKLSGAARQKNAVVMPHDSNDGRKRRDLPEKNAWTRRKRSRSPTSLQRRRSRSRELNQSSESRFRPPSDFITDSRTAAAFDFCKRAADERSSSGSKSNDMPSKTEEKKILHVNFTPKSNIHSRPDHHNRSQSTRQISTGELSDEHKREELKELPNFGLSGKLLEDTNKVRGTIVKYAEPPEARIPNLKWRLYTFKDTVILATLHIYRQSSYLFGRDRKVVDIPLDHPSCSKQHAALQFRAVKNKQDDLISYSGPRQTIKPYIIDLGSANGTFINKERIEPQRYVELLEKDVIKFGFSTRDYVILHDSVKEAADSSLADPGVHDDRNVQFVEQGEKHSNTAVHDIEDDEQNLGLPEIPDVDKIQNEAQKKRLHRLTNESLTDF